MDEKTGQAAGFDVDSLNWIAKTMGVEITHKPMAWDGIIPALLAKQIDMVGSGMSITPERSKMVQFSDPYWTVSRVFLVPADSKLTPEDILSQKIKLGVQRGTSEANAIKQEQQEKGYPFELRFYETRASGRGRPAQRPHPGRAHGRTARRRRHHQGPRREKGRHPRQARRLPRGSAQGRQRVRALIDEGYRKLMADRTGRNCRKSI